MLLYFFCWKKNWITNNSLFNWGAWQNVLSICCGNIFCFVPNAFFGAVPTNKTFVRKVLKHRLILSGENRVILRMSICLRAWEWHINAFPLTKVTKRTKLRWWKNRKFFCQHRFSLTNWHKKTESKSAKIVLLQLHQLQMVSHSSPDVINEVLRLPTVSERLWKASKVCHFWV